jgi:CRISPR system Cascade subunit CasC
MLIELHLIQNFAPANLNRDDTNNPKDCDFGGVRRARISSQCFKRAIRSEPVFTATTAVANGVRTRWMNRLIAETLTQAGKEPTLAQTVADVFSVNYSKLDKNHTSVLIYLSQNEVETICRQILAQWDEITASLKDNKSPALEVIAKDLFKAIKNRTGAPDIALFGRMLAENPELNIDAACQVAHAISTHAVNMDMDFFTAVDDLQKKEDTGAGMMGMTGFNSACFYRYACIDFSQLATNLGGDVALARKTVEAFLRASAAAVPTGKQNSFAAQNPPSFYMTVVRAKGSAWSLANAFEKPVQPGGQGLVYASVKALDTYWGKLADFFGAAGQPVVAAVDGESALEHLKPAQVGTLAAWIEETLNQLPQE